MKQDHLSWLTSVPASDQNFKEALKKSDLATCEEALKHVTGKGTRAAIEARIKKLFHQKMEGEGAKLISPRPAASNSRAEVTTPLAKDSAPGQVFETPAALVRFGGQLAARPPAGALVVADDEHVTRGLQIELQWDRAVGGQRDQLLFGAMMIKLREWIDSARGVDKRGHAKFDKGTGLKAWLKKYAPKVSESTAYRLMEIAEGVQAICKLGKTVDLEELLGASVETLPAALAAKREKIEQLIEGKSQRQLLLQFSAGLRGGNQYDRTEKGRGKTGVTALPPGQQALEILAPAFEELMRHWPQHWVHLPHHLLKEWDGHLMDMRRQIKKALGE